MAEVIEMPLLSDSMTVGVIAAWHKAVGDEVSSGELLAEIETDKATMELESFFDGVLLHIAGGDGAEIPVGHLLAIVGAAGEDVSSVVEEYKKKAESSGAEEAPAEEKVAVAEPVAAVASVGVAAPAVAAGSTGNGRLKASPLAKAMAKENSIDIGLVSGTGDGGRIVKRDIEAFIESGASRQAAPAVQAVGAVGQESYRDERNSQMRKTIARRLSESKNTAPHFYLTMEIDMSRTWDERKRINEVAPVKISFNDLIVKASAAALRQHPQVNASWMGDNIRYYDHIHVGVAVAVDEGLLVPVIRFADAKSLSQISTETRGLAEKARDRKLQPDEMQGNTFTISNLGMFGIEEFTAIINSPDSCILAVGGIVEKPVVRNGEIVPGRIMKVTMSCDHRVVDGAVGAAFLQTLKSYLEDPVRILI